MSSGTAAAAAADETLPSFAGFRFYPIRAPRVRRISQLLVGLVLFGTGLALGVEAALGVNPWVVFAQGLAQVFDSTVGTMIVATGAALVLLFGPIREPLGLGTLLNVLVIGFVVDLVVWLIPDTDSLAVRIPMLIAVPIVVGLASGIYIGAGLGPGPRDGMMLALSRTGLSVRTARTLIELTALAIGWYLGGDANIGTLWFALTVGFWTQRFLPHFTIPTAVQHDR